MKLQNEPKEDRFGTTFENTKNEPKTWQLALIRRFDIWTIFLRTVAAGGMRSRDVTGKIGEIPRLMDVTGRA